MSDKLITWLLKIAFIGLLAATAATFWYYTTGRKPKVLLSAQLQKNDFSATVRAIGPGEVLLLSGAKVTLFDLDAKKERWSASLKAAAPAPAATPVPKPLAKASATPMPTPRARPDPLIAARVQKRFAKLEKWAADLNAKRAKLKTPLQIEGFNEEAAKYHAELTAARAEAGMSNPARPAPPPAVPREEANDLRDERWSVPARTEIAIVGDGVWIAQGRQLTGFGRADGHVLQAVTLPGNVISIEAGAGELFVVAAAGQSRDVQVSRVTAGNAPVQSFHVAVPPEPHAEEWREGSPVKPVTPEHRILFGANRSSLLQLDVRLIERKLTERQAIAGESGSDMEAADRKTTGGFGNDALVFAQALSREAERDATGGKEIIDESIYEITLQRPFARETAVAKAQVHGRAELFATPSLDLIVAGRELVAFDHSNKKLWQAQLAQPIAPAHRSAWSSGGVPPPWLESGDRLYFFDTAYLTAFQKQTGQPAWRLPQKAIHEVQIDEAGHLYITTQPGELGAVPQLFQLDAKNGRIVWKLEKYDGCYVSGKDLYAARETRNAGDMVNAVFDRSKAPQCRWKLYKLSTRTGEPQWEWFQTRRPTNILADRKRVSLLFADELQVLTSIAL